MPTARVRVLGFETAFSISSFLLWSLQEQEVMAQVLGRSPSPGWETSIEFQALGFSLPLALIVVSILGEQISRWRSGAFLPAFQKK